MTNIIQSGGWPQNYPYATSSPLPSAILRPLQQPIYDTELIAGGAASSEIIFFQRQVGQTLAQTPSSTSTNGNIKTLVETNLSQPGQLPNPLEFSLFGFLVEMNPGITVADFNTVYKTGLFTFTYTGNRVYLQVPVTRIPQGVSPEGFAAIASTGTSGSVAATTSISEVHNGVGHISNLYKFTIGRAALRIRPTESFQVRLNWNSAQSPSITPVADVRIRVFLVGLTWTAL
jgi:hypothetical protein